MSVLIFLIVSYILLSISLYFVFRKAGVEPIKGLIPGVNFIEWCKLIGRKPIYALWLLFPIVNIFIYCGMCVDLVRSFKRYKFLDTVLAVIYAPIIFFQLAFSEKDKYDEPTLPKEKAYAIALEEAKKKKDNLAYNRLMKDNPYKKSAPREWAESIFFAVFAAAFIRMFLIEAYVIPTPSMEGTQMVGDFLFVSKAHYGIRTPMTIAMVPLLHNVIPGLGSESYLKKPQLPYKRLPALEEIDRLEPIVFNWPVGDSIFLTSRSYSYAMVKEMAEKKQFYYDPPLQKEWQEQNFRTRPVDKKDHYIKRCLAIAGDSLEIINGQVYVNGEKSENPSGMQRQTMIMLPSGMLTSDVLKLDLFNLDTKVREKTKDMIIAYLNESERAEVAALNPDIRVFPFFDLDVLATGFKETGMVDSLNLQKQTFSSRENPLLTRLMLDEEQLESIKAHPLSSEFIVTTKDMFPQKTASAKDWTVDNYGPIYIPKAGEEVVITSQNLGFYERIINVYENNDLKVERGRVFINGTQTTTYTFKQDYFWAMGDNRHNSEDSRVWGFVPEDHIVGKPLFIWFSLRNGKLFDGIRFNRIFRGADAR